MRTKILLASLLCFSAMGFAQSLKTGQLANVTRLTNDSGVKYENPRFSPDGKKVAFTKLGYDGLYVANSDGTAKKQVSAANGVGYMYQWSADGAEILCRDTRDVRAASGFPRSHAVWTVDVATGKATRLSQDGAAELRPAAWRYNNQAQASVVAAGKVVAAARPVKMMASANAQQKAALQREMAKPIYKTSFVTDYDHLYVVNAAGTQKAIFNGPAFAPQLSPDGKKVAFCNMTDDIIVMNIDGTGQQNVGKGFNPVWANNRQIVVQRTTDDGHDFLTGDLFMINIADKSTRQLTNTPGRIEMNPAISADGSKILFSTFDDGQIYIADLK